MKWWVDFSAVDRKIKNPKKIPRVGLDNLQAWAEQVELFGLDELKKISRYRDHALQGKRAGQRAIYLSFKWRAIYTVTKSTSETINILKIEEITPHDYRKKN